MVSGKLYVKRHGENITKYIIIILFQALWLCACAQNKLVPSQIDEVLLKLPEPTNHNNLNNDVLKAIEIVDKNYRQISDTLYYWKSFTHTIFQTIPIETNDSILISPLSFGNKLILNSIVFNNRSLNTRLKRFSKGLRKAQRNILYEYLKENYDYFSSKTKTLIAKAVRIRYIKFPDNRFVHVGIDIYGAHFLWLIDRNQDWKIIKVERLWVY